MALLLNFIFRQFQNIFNHFHLVLLIILFRAVAYNAQGFHNDHLANDDLLNAHTTRTMPHNTCAVRTYHSTPRPCIVLLLLQHYIQCPWIWKNALRPTALNSQALWPLQKKVSLHAFVWSWRREHIVCLFSGRSHQDWSHFGLLYSRQQDRLAKVAGMPFVHAAQYMFSRGWAKLFWRNKSLAKVAGMPLTISSVQYSVIFSSGWRYQF